MIFVIALIKMRPCNKVSLVKQYVQVYSTYSGGSGGSGRLSRRKYTVRILTLCASLSSIMAAVGNQTNKHFSVAQKTAAVQMRKANVPLKTIRNQLKSTNCRTMAEWILEIKRLWVLRMEDSDYLKKLVESMPRRLAEVIERGGACTKY